MLCVYIEPKHRLCVDLGPRLALWHVHSQRILGSKFRRWSASETLANHFQPEQIYEIGFTLNEVPLHGPFLLSEPLGLFSLTFSTLTGSSYSEWYFRLRLLLEKHGTGLARNWTRDLPLAMQGLYFWCIIPPSPKFQISCMWFVNTDSPFRLGKGNLWLIWLSQTSFTCFAVWRKCEDMGRKNREVPENTASSFGSSFSCKFYLQAGLERNLESPSCSPKSKLSAVCPCPRNW